MGSPEQCASRICAADRASWPGSWLMMASIVPCSRKRRVYWVSSWAIQTTSRVRPASSNAAAMPRLPAPAAVDAEQVGLPFQKFRRQAARAFAVVAPFERRQREQIGIFARQDLVEAELALGVIAQRQRSGDHGRPSPLRPDEEAVPSASPRCGRRQGRRCRHSACRRELGASDTRVTTATPRAASSSIAARTRWDDRARPTATPW